MSSAVINNNLQHVQIQLRRNPPQQLEIPKRSPCEGFVLKRPARPVRLTFQKIEQKIAAAAAAATANPLPPPPPSPSPLPPKSSSFPRLVERPTDHASSFAEHSAIPATTTPSAPPLISPTVTASSTRISTQFSSYSNHPLTSVSSSSYNNSHIPGFQTAASALGSAGANNYNHHQHPNHMNTTVARRPVPTAPQQQDEFDDDDDEFFANLDVDNLVASAAARGNHHPLQRSPPPVGYAASAPPPVTSNTFDYNTNDTLDSSLPNAFPYEPPSTDPSAPLCSGHHLPCILLTARSEHNSGRQFYKCSQQQEQQCDFFEWADGLASNTASSAPAAIAHAPGDIKDVFQESKYKFGHRSFRPGQQEVIENAVRGRDVFVLMPTGGGKSLCYQCPAWCFPGLAVVISPLLSLIQDQVQSMNKLGVESVFLSGSQDYHTEQVDITRRLHAVQPHGGVKLLYITPEKLSNSPMLQNILSRLHGRNLLSRFVIDEAHCLSDWGHDFRPDYNRLSLLRQTYPGVPLMALTATANEKVVNDAIRCLGMTNPYRYVSSFNRPNLRYQVLKKDAKTIDAIASYVTQRGQDSGVIYCLSRKDCEKVAEQLQEKGVTASFYHAELDTHERERRHHDWSNGRISVLCATIAFGMGIDKPDVRYVIHFSLPKSITHYYQESGRAGRDRDAADCILYYSYKDKKILEHMIVKSANDPYGPATRRKIDQLYACVRYCEDEFRCRRTMQLEFFGETFDSAKCNKTCDNCRAGRIPEPKDLTNEAQTILRLLASIQTKKRTTLAQLTDLFRGSKSQSATKSLDTNRLTGYGAGSKFKKYEVDRMLHSMIFDRIIVETAAENQGGFSSDYVDAAENAPAILAGQRKFHVNFPNATSRAVPEKKTKTQKKRKANTKLAVDTKLDKTYNSKDQSIMILDDDQDEDGSITPPSTVPGSKPRIPKEKVRALSKRIQSLATNWAEEERFCGKNIFYWHIVSAGALKAISTAAPKTLEELESIGVLGQEILKEYGDRIVKVVNGFLSQEGLVQSPPPTAQAAKRVKSESSKYF